MLNFFIILENFYSKYEETEQLKTRINLINKIAVLERKIIYNLKDENNVLEYIIGNYSKKTEFIRSRYVYFLNNIYVDKKHAEKVLEIYLENLKNYKLYEERKDLVYFSIKGLEKFYFKNFEDTVIELNKYKIFSLYKKEFILLLGKTAGTIKSINFLMEQTAKFSELSDEIHWSIGMLASYKKYPMIKR